MCLPKDSSSKYTKKKLHGALLFIDLEVAPTFLPNALKWVTLYLFSVNLDPMKSRKSTSYEKNGDYNTAEQYT